MDFHDPDTTSDHFPTDRLTPRESNGRYAPTRPARPDEIRPTTQSAIGGVLVGAGATGAPILVSMGEPGLILFVLVVVALVGGIEMVLRAGRS